MRFSFIDGKMDSKKFIALIKKLHKDAGKPILVITDNARYHHSKATQAFIEKPKGANQVVFLPACSPERNPDEQVRNHAKARLSKRGILTKEDMKAGLLLILSSLQKQTTLIERFFRMKETQYILGGVT